MSACGNEESTKLYLVLPILGLFGYDYSNPYEVYPQYSPDPNQPNKVDLAVLRDGQPVIAIECKKVSTDLADARDELRAHYNSIPTTKLGILTNGIVFEFFVDSTEPNSMDEDPYLTLDLESVWRNGVSDEVLEALVHVTKASFDPETIAELAHVRLVKKRLRTSLLEEASTPSEEFCRFFLQRAGPQAGAQGRHRPLLRPAHQDRLRRGAGAAGRAEAAQRPGRQEHLAQPAPDRPAHRHQRARAHYRRLRPPPPGLPRPRRGACSRPSTASSTRTASASWWCYYVNERKGRLFDYIEGAEGFDKFIFPAPYGEIVTKSVLDIDEPLAATFAARVRDLGHLHSVERLARIA